jgi:GDP-L-fucose synthase
VIPALIRKMHDAKIAQADSVCVWGSGTPKREFLYSEDLASACLFLMNLPDNQFMEIINPAEKELSASSENGMVASSENRMIASSEKGSTMQFPQPPLVNIGVGEDLSIAELANLIREVVGFKGEIVFDTTKPDGTPRKVLCVDKMTALGWRYKTSLRDGLIKTYQTYCQSIINQMDKVTA